MGMGLSKQNDKNNNNSISVNRKINLRVLYEDPDVVVVTAPNEDELRRILIELLKESPMSLKELHSVLSGLASEDKIRKALSVLMEQGVVGVQRDGKYYIFGL